MAAYLSDIASIIRDVLRDDQIDIDALTRFDDIPGWDSMDLVSVVVEAESRFDLQFDLTEIDRLTKVHELLDMIQAKQGLAAA